MQISILFFASAQDATGSSDITWECAEGTTIEQCVLELQARYPALTALVPRLRFAVNAEFAAPSAVLNPGDALALLPPMSGG